MLLSTATKSGNIRKKQRSIALAAGFSLLFSLSLTASFQPVWAAAESDPNLNKLEVKFFEHDYAKEDTGTRLDRLEKMVFGETKTGDPTTRLNNLVGAVPNLNAAPQDDGASSKGAAGSGETASSGDTGGSTEQDAPRKSAGSPTRTAKQPAPPPEREDDAAGDTTTQYPAVSAIEKRLFNKDYQGDPISKRVERLEVKAFGKPNPTNSDDLSERVDRLKRSTGVDIAKSAPPGTDWADDDEPRGGGDLTYTPATPGQTTPFTNDGEDGKSFSGRDLRKDMQQAFGRPATSSWYGGTGQSGTYGMPSGRGGYGSSGTYGMGAGAGTIGGGQTGGGRGALDQVSPAGMGLSQQVALLENELFRKTFGNETIPSRLTRLEGIVFPGQRTPSDMSMPDRVSRLVAAVPISEPGVAPRRTVAQKRDPDDLDDDQMPPTAPPPRSGLSRIISGLGNLVGGGGYGAAPYASNLVSDPTTGLLYDRVSGNYIDPATGVVIPRSTLPMAGTVPMAVPVPVPVSPGYGYATPYNPYSNGGYNPYGRGGLGSSFNNGLSPIGSPYGSYGSGMRFGFGGSGIRFGGGGIGGLGGTMGPGMGIWP
jgi:hypothetical protein